MLLKQFIKILITLLFFCEGQDIFAQVGGKSGQSLIDSLKRHSSFTIYGDNYLITGTKIGRSPSSTNSDAKFQIGFKQLLAGFGSRDNSFLFLTYHQISFWDIYQNSYPFRDNIYNPSLVFGKMLIKNGKPGGGVLFALEHESNGLSGNDSRGWNFISLRYSTKLFNDWYGSMKGWLPIGTLEDNEDLLDYKSHFEGSLTFYPSNRLIFESEFRRSFTREWLGKILLAANYRLSKDKNHFIYLQYYNGHAESLIDYQKHIHIIRIGITFKDLTWLIFE